MNDLTQLTDNTSHYELFFRIPTISLFSSLNILTYQIQRPRCKISIKIRPMLPIDILKCKMHSFYVIKFICAIILHKQMHIKIFIIMTQEKKN